ncbi:MAG: ATP-binding cassette domain-containing protein, partial [Eubacteriales bacterium]
MSNQVIEFKNVTKSYDGGEAIIQDLNLSIPEGELVTILGPSGCGKTTLLKMVNKLIVPDSGSIFVNGVDIQDIDTIDLRRAIGYVIQQIGLLPHLTVKQNINYVLSLQKKGAEIKDARAVELINLVGLDASFLDRHPRQLSGGQKQRVGVARALAANPAIILMDEPFGAVDEIARTILQDELIKIHGELKKTILFVTHDIEEALKLGTKIILLNNAKIEQIGTREELIFHPKSEFVKTFFGLKGLKASLDNDVLSRLYD